MKHQFKKFPPFPNEEGDISLGNTQRVESASVVDHDTRIVPASERLPTNNPQSLTADQNTLAMPTMPTQDIPIAPMPGMPIAPLPGGPTRPVQNIPIIPMSGMPTTSAPGAPIAPMPGMLTTPAPDTPMIPIPGVPTKPGTPDPLSPQASSANFLQRMMAMILVKAKESDPERLSQTLFQRAIRLRNRPLGWLSLVLLIQAAGVLLVAYGAAAAIHTATDQQIFLWFGIALIFAPGFFRLLLPLPSRAERTIILCSTGLCIYLLPIILSPLHFIFVDEYMHLRTVSDIVKTGHLFSQNPVLPVSSLYPGIEVVTDALHSLSGLDVSTAGIIVVGVARTVVMLTLLLLFEQITKSSRTASIAAMLYGANAGFFMFDSLFLYEALGIALGVVMLFALYRAEGTDGNRRGLLLAACIALGALTATHHVSDLFFVGLLVVWMISHRFTRQPVFRSNTLEITLIGLLFAVVWILFIARPVIGYLLVPFTSALAQLQSVLTGGGLGRHLFVDHTGGHPTPLLSQLVMLASIALVTLSIPFAFICLWHRYRFRAFPFALALVSLLYPFTQALRMTSQSANIPDRASPYIFIAVSFALATLITQLWPVKKLKWKQTTIITFLASLVFLGSNMLGAGPGWRLMPSGYLVGDDGRSVTLEGIQTASWALTHLGPNNRFYADSTNALLMNSYGEQRIVSLTADDVNVAPVYYATEMHGWEISILRSAQLHYLVVDKRLTTALPVKGYYFEGYEPPDVNVTTPLSPQALSKFNTVPQFNRIYDSGNIVIYDVSPLVDAN
jgi:hypothetical protein